MDYDSLAVFKTSYCQNSMQTKCNQGIIVCLLSNCFFYIFWVIIMMKTILIIFINNIKCNYFNQRIMNVYS